MTNTQMTNAHLRPVDEATILSRFSSSSEGFPLVIEQAAGHEDRGLLSVAKIYRGPKLETVADLVIDPGTGQITKHRIVNDRGQWRDSQIVRWVREAEDVLVDLAKVSASSSPDPAS